MISERLRNAAQGRWKSILLSMGVDARIVSGRHGPCPKCGGKDRFRFTDYEGRGLYVCNQCGGGDGFHLAHMVTGMSYGEICKQVEVLAGTVVPQVERRSNGMKEVLEREWERAKPIQVGSPVAAYLKYRGLMAGSRHLRFVDGLTVEGVTCGAMMAEITDEEGKRVGFHYTYLWKEGGVWKKAKVKTQKRTRKVAQTISGGSIKLYAVERGGLIGLTEGIETAIAVRQLFGTPTWACMSTSGLKNVKLSEEVKRVIVYADHDRNFSGQKAAFELANRLKVKDKFEGEVVVQICPMVGDYLDGLVTGYFGKIERWGT